MASTQTLQPTNPSAQAQQSNVTSTIKSAGSLLSSTSKLSTSDAIKSLRNVMTNGPPTIAIHWFGLSVLAVILIWIMSYIITKLNLGQINCANIQSTNTNDVTLNSDWINSNSPDVQYRDLRDYYIKTAYNCCASGEFRNDYVNLCALKNVIRQGVRCLDFEIYCMDNKPVVATSAIDVLGIKETYNSLPISDVLNEVSITAFSHNATTIVNKKVVPQCPNPDDPLLLHFRLKTNDVKVLNTLGAEIAKYFSDRLMPIQYMKENNFKNMTGVPVKDMKGKVIIMVEKTGPLLYQSNNLWEVTNVTTNSTFIREMRYFDVKNISNMNELEEYNKQNMTIVLPDLKDTNENYTSYVPMAMGCQMCAMNFQNVDENLNAYNANFEKVKSAFVLRPEKLRYVPTYVDIPPPPNPILAYNPWKISTAGGLSFTL
jgi:hypothetical protein